jgi:hypothetical protein
MWLAVGLSGIVAAGIPKNEIIHRDNNDGFSQEWLAGHLKEAKQEVLIVSGEFDPRVYNDVAPIIVESLNKNKKLVVRMLAGPRVLTSQGKNLVYDLYQQNPFPGRLFIDFLSERPDHHFRVVDSKHLFVEDPHRPIDNNRHVHVLERGFIKPYLYRQAFNRLSNRLSRTPKPELLNIDKPEKAA